MTATSRRRVCSLEQLEQRRLLAFNPTADEQHLLQLVNRLRTDPTAEFGRLMVSTSPLVARDPILQVDLDFAQVNGAVLKSQLESLAAVPPLAWNEAISNFTAGHNAQMLSTNPPQQFHSNTLQRRQALLDAGVKLRFAQGELINSENVFGYGKSVMHIYGAFVVDWLKGGPDGMQPGTGHRRALMNRDYEQIGQSITTYAGANFGPLVTTQVIANIENPPAMAVGAVFQDRNQSGWYEAGEGIGGVQIVFSGAAGTFSTQALAAGGYQIALPPGVYTATATGGGMQHPVIARDVVVGSTNVWRNLIYDPTAIPPAPPVAELDRATVSSVAPSVTLNVIANDRDPDGTAAQLVPQLAAGTSPAFSLAGSQVTYIAPAGVSGVQRASYTVRDQQGLLSPPANIEIFVVNYSAAQPWHNPLRATDVNDDGSTTPLDALLIVNEINRLGAGPLPTSSTAQPTQYGFLDTSGDGFLTALDSLLVINRLNGGAGEGEAVSEPLAAPAHWHDQALAQLEEEEWPLLDNRRLSLPELPRHEFSPAAFSLAEFPTADISLPDISQSAYALSRKRVGLPLDGWTSLGEA